MYERGKKLLAGPCLSGYQNVGIRRRDLSHKIDTLLDQITLADDTMPLESITKCVLLLVNKILVTLLSIEYFARFRMRTMVLR